MSRIIVEFKIRVFKHGSTACQGYNQVSEEFLKSDLLEYFCNLQYTSPLSHQTSVKIIEIL